jgi:hypothetical protein
MSLTVKVLDTNHMQELSKIKRKATSVFRLVCDIGGRNLGLDLVAGVCGC